jgi:alpha/beta superfamily hydrolase
MGRDARGSMAVIPDAAMVMASGKGLVLLSHGLESGPEATKVVAMGEVARSLGWDELRLDYRDLDATRDVARLDERIARLSAAVPSDGRPLVFAGSSMGAFISGFASLVHPCRGVFLLAPPIRIPGYARALDVRAGVPLAVVHGWDDELIAADAVVDWARARRAALHLVDDSHRLTAHVDIVAAWFGEFLERLP